MSTDNLLEDRVIFDLVVFALGFNLTILHYNNFISEIDEINCMSDQHSGFVFQ